MTWNHHHSRVPAERMDSESGYILAMMGLLLVPLLLMVGLSVDVGSWYNRASDVQKAADSAALAGVVWLPSVHDAEIHALEAAARNGFVHDPSGTGITVTVEPVDGTSRRLRVTITDPSVSSFFYGALGGSNVGVSRRATAQYVLPVPLGSPENQFGGVDGKSDPVGSGAPGLWGNIHGVRTDNRKGDAFAPQCRGSDRCSTFFNDWFRPSGYLYTIDVPDGVSNLSVQVYDAGFYDRGSDESVDTGDRLYNTGGSTTTHWTFYDRDLTELDVSDNPPAATVPGLCASGTPGQWSLAQGQDAGVHRNRWATICRIDGTVTPGRYLLRVQVTGDGAMANRYAIRAVATSATQPRIAAYGDMSMFNNISTGNANFYLAEVGPEHRGKTLEIRLYDPGEVTGNSWMRILEPSGGIAASCLGLHDGTAANHTFNSGDTLAPCEFQASQNGARFDGVWITLQIPIPNDYDCDLGELPGCWWRIQYAISGTAQDTTTWSAQVIGDPVHLVEE